VNVKAKDYAQQYLEQRARGAYLASVCQPEAAFDLSAAAQASNPTPEDAAALNKRLQWQMKHLDRGLDYIALDLSICKLFIFANGSFANNKNLSSQLGFLIHLANEMRGSSFFELASNIVHWSSTKCKRITRSVLVSEIYDIMNNVNTSIALATIFRLITN
jgi:hypothetical protein